MKERLNKIEKKLETHVAQYAQNSKEVMKLAKAVENITREVKEHFAFSKENKLMREAEEKKLREELTPILESYQALVGGRKIFLGVVVTLSAIGSLYLLIKGIFINGK